MSLQIFIQVIGAFFGVISLAIVFQVPKKYLVYAGLTGGGGWWIYLVLVRVLPMEMLAVFVAALYVAIISQIFARVFKAPVNVFLVTGILPLVPGIAMYRMVFYLLRGKQAESMLNFSYVLQTSGMIALAIFMVDSFFRIRRKNK